MRIMNNIEYIQPNIFNRKTIISGVTLRNQNKMFPRGVSFSFNQSYPDNEVTDFRSLLADLTGVGTESLKFQKQVHGTNIRIIDAAGNEEEADAQVTRQKGIVLCIKIADCLALLLHDPVKSVIAAVHSGWRGTKENIAGKMVNLLISNYGTNPENLLAYLSPCASGKNYEVGWDVARYFPNSIEEIGNGKYLFENRKEVLEQIRMKGVPLGNIEVSDICTIENEAFHSYRRDGVQSGRMAAFIGMKL